MGWFDWFKGSDKKEANVANNVTETGTISREKSSAEIQYERNLALAMQGNAKAMYEVAMCYYSGEVVVENKKKAMEYLMSAAKKGYIDAYYWMGLMYEEGTTGEKDFLKAFEYYKKGAEGGDYASEAMLGKLYMYGQGTPRNMGLAYKWLSRSKSDMFFSAYYLGEYYIKTGNKAEAIRMFEKVSKEGLAKQFEAEQILKTLYKENKSYQSKSRELEEKQKRSGDLLDRLVECIKEDGTII